MSEKYYMLDEYLRTLTLESNACVANGVAIRIYGEVWSAVAAQFADIIVFNFHVLRTLNLDIYCRQSDQIVIRTKKLQKRRGNEYYIHNKQINMIRIYMRGKENKRDMDASEW